MSTYQVVISRFEEDINWVRNIKMPVVVYNKGASATGLEMDLPVIRRPNFGRESETYLHHIIENYDSLPDYLVLLQGYPIDHCYDLFTILSDHADSNVVVPLSECWKRETLDAEYNWPGFKEYLLSLGSLIGLRDMESLSYSTGAQYIVPREMILRRPKSQYQELITKVNYSVNPLEGYVMERLWPYVFGANDVSNMYQFDIVWTSGSQMHAVSQAISFVLSHRSDIVFNVVVVGDTKCDTGEMSWLGRCKVTLVNTISDALQYVLKSGRDLVCFIRGDEVSIDKDLFLELFETYYYSKFTINNGREVVLSLMPNAHDAPYTSRYGKLAREFKNPNREWKEGDAGSSSFITHHQVLRKHWTAFLENGVVNVDAQRLLNGRNVPIFFPAVSDKK